MSLEAAQRMAELEGQLVARGRAREESLHGALAKPGHSKAFERLWGPLVFRTARGWGLFFFPFLKLSEKVSL